MGFSLGPHKTASYFYDASEDLGNLKRCAWTITAVPEAVLDGEANPEQIVEVTDIYLLRKGPNAAPPGTNKLQLNWTIRNRGGNPVSGRVTLQQDFRGNATTSCMTALLATTTGCGESAKVLL
jgi:hypothetical protein